LASVLAASRTRPLVLGATSVWILVLVAMVPRMELSAARVVMGGSLLLANVFALTGALARARRFPAEAWSWRVMAVALVFASTANVFTGLRGGAVERPLWDTLMVGFYFAAALAGILALIRLPLAARHPEGFRIHLLGSLIFASSLALLLWILGLWQPDRSLGFADRGILLAICVRVSVMGGILAYQITDHPRRLRGPLGWLVLGIVFGGFPAMFAINQGGVSTVPLSPAVGFAPLFAVAMAAAAWHPAPADGPGEAVKTRGTLFTWLLYLPYFGTALCLLVASVRASSNLLVPMLGFLAVSTLLVIHQFALLREVRLSRDDLDRRVRVRTEELERAQAVLLNAERMNSLGLLGAGMAHDLNNALGAILSTLELARARGGGAHLTDDDLVRIDKAARHGAEMGRRLMAFARQGAESDQVLDLRRVLQEDRELLRMVLPSRIRLDVDPGPLPLPVRGGRGQVQQILVNLVANAKDAIEGTGNVRICAMAVGAWAELQVSDSGCGMSPEIQARIFEPLFTTKEPGRGTGLGLASVKAILDRMGGEVEVHSAPGAGTTFALRFRLSEGDTGELPAILV